MSKTIKIISLGCVALSFFICGIIFQKTANRSTTQFTIKDERILIRSITNMIQYNNIKIPDIKVSDKDGNTSKLSSYIKGESFLIYLPTISCMSCASRELESINNYFDVDIKKRVCIVGKFNNIREQTIFERNSGIRCLQYADVIAFPSKKLTNFTVYCLLDPSMYISCCLYNNTNDINIDINCIYYSAISKRMK